MTIQELYDWGKKHDCLDVTISKNCNLECVDVLSVFHIKEEIECYDEMDRVVID